MNKTCNCCGKNLSEKDFYRNGKKRSSHNTCKKCFSTNIQIRMIIKKIKAINFLGGKCIKCGTSNVIVLEFHHNNYEEKEAMWNNLKRLSWDKIIKELNKCTLLCANCHTIEHASFYNILKTNHIEISDTSNPNIISKEILKIIT